MTCFVLGGKRGAHTAAHNSFRKDITVFHSSVSGLEANQVHELVRVHFSLDLVSRLELIPATAHLATPAFHLDLAAALLDVLGDTL